MAYRAGTGKRYVHLHFPEGPFRSYTPRRRVARKRQCGYLMNKRRNKGDRRGGSERVDNAIERRGIGVAGVRCGIVF